MTTLQELIPDADLLLSMSDADLAPTLLRLGRNYIQNGMFQPAAVSMPGIHPSSPRYPYDKQTRIDILIAEGWEWLKRHCLIVQAAGVNGKNGWMCLTPKGETIANYEDFEALKAAVAFPKDYLHPSIADQVWVTLARNDLETAVSIAFKAVEVAVRDASGLPTSDFGTRLMRKAFEKANGPLANPALSDEEKDGMAKLFEGAISFVRNPHAHRLTGIERQEACDRLLLASYLLRIVDARRESSPARAKVVNTPATSL